LFPGTYFWKNSTNVSVFGLIATLNANRAGLRTFCIIHKPKYELAKTFNDSEEVTGDCPVVLIAVYVASNNDET